MIRKIVKAAGSAWGQRITILVLICIVMAISQPVFFHPNNATNILQAIAVIGIMSCGMLFTVLVGGMDLSVGSMAGLAASVTFKIAELNGFSDNSFILGFLLALLLCLLVGYLNGFFVTSFGLPAFVVTLAMRYVLYGIIPQVTNGYLIINPKSRFIHQLGNHVVLTIPLKEGMFRVPMPVILLIIVVAIAAFILVKTTYGRKLYAIGGNRRAANLVGIHSSANIRGAFMISSVIAGFGGGLLASMNGQAGLQTALGYEGSVLMAMVVGGINLAGGEGGVPGAVFGALLVGIINNVLLLLSVSSDTQKFIQGIIILGAMTLNMYARRGTAGMLKVKL